MIFLIEKEKQRHHISKALPIRGLADQLPIRSLLRSNENLRAQLTKRVCDILPIFLKNGEIVNQQLKYLQRHPDDKSTIFSNLKQMCKSWRLSSPRPLLNWEALPRCCYLEGLQQLAYFV